MLAKLEEITGYYSTYSSAIKFGGRKYGIGLVSKEKPITVRKIALPGAEEERTFIIAEFNNYIFCNTHFSLTQKDQLASVDIINNSIKEFIKEDKNRKKKPLFLAGDFNAEFGTPTINKLTENFVPISNYMYKTLPSKFPDRCIYYIFYHGNKLPKKYIVYKSGTIRNSATEISSDYLPVQCVIYAVST